MTDLLKEGLVLMFVGMGVVFALLVVLVFVIQAVSKVSARFSPATAPPAPPSPPTGRPAVDEEIISAIGAAVRLYRRRRGGKR